METIQLKKYFDARGSLVENTLEAIMLQSKHFFISKSVPGAIRGNHYHTHKREYFIVIQGTCRISTENVVSKEREERTISDTDNLAVLMEVNTAHAIENIGKNELILLALVNEVMDQTNPDTIRYEVV